MIKAKFDTEELSVHLGVMFASLGISPNAWTVLALVPAALGLVALCKGVLFPGLVFFAISGLIDAIDGAVARVTKSTSSLGAFLDGVIDRYVEMALYLGLAAYLWNESFMIPAPAWIIILVFGALMPTFVRAYADHRGVVTDSGKQKEMGGLLERFERLMLLYAGMFLGLFIPSLIILTVALAAILANITALQRIIFVVKESK